MCRAFVSSSLVFFSLLFLFAFVPPPPLPLSPSLSPKLNGIQLPAPCVFSRSRLSPFIINRNMSSLYSLILLIWSGLSAYNDMQY